VDNTAFLPSTLRVRHSGRRQREYPERPFVGVGAIIVESGRVVFVKRGHAPALGEWSIPGGMLEVGETLREAAIRETREETGLIVEPGELLGVFDRVLRDELGRTQYHFVLIDFLCRGVGGELRPAEDAAEVRWFTAEEVNQNFSPLRELYGRGLRHLDLAVITHPHRDHMDGIHDLSFLPTLTFDTPWHLSENAIRKGNRTNDQNVVEEYLNIRRSCTFPVIAQNDATNAANLDGVSLNVFGGTTCDDGNLNNHSRVVVVSYANLKMVIPGDNEGPSWNELLRDLTFVMAIKGTDVFLASHHGRDAGYSSDLFKAMGKPRLIVISDGRFCETSATGRYSSQATGWTVYDAAGAAEVRKCVTTRCDGHITIKFGWNADSGNFRNVTTSKINSNALLARILAGR
jgi:ADP-ribose pyrophosphatase YjhB (NUDIX family)